MCVSVCASIAVQRNTTPRQPPLDIHARSMFFAMLRACAACIQPLLPLLLYNLLTLVLHCQAKLAQNGCRLPQQQQQQPAVKRKTWE